MSSAVTAPPAVSVVMAVYNSERYLSEAVRSILGQTLGDFELIALDDGSTDGSLKILNDFARQDPRVRVVTRPNKGLTATLNEGIALARGEFIARMDGDDVAYPDRFARQVEFLRARPDVVCAGGSFELIDGKGRLLTRLDPPADDADIQKSCLAGHTAVCHPAAMMRADAARKVGGYDTYFKTTQDLDMWLRLGEVGRLANLPDVLLQFRQHEGSVSETKRLEQRRFSREACERAWKRRGITDGRFEAAEPWRPGKDRKSRHRYAMQYGWWAFASGQRRTAMVYAFKAVGALPFNAAGWKLIACAALKPAPAPVPTPLSRI